MSLRQAFLSILHLFVVLIFSAAGFFFIVCPHQLAMNAPLIGSALLLASLILLLGFYVLDRGRYLVLQMGISTNLNVISQTIEDCFSRQFSEKIALSEIEIGQKSRLDIKVSVSSLDPTLFAEVEKELGLLLRNRFGYTKPFRLIVKL